MKKFIFTANVIALLFLVPSLLVSYLTADKKTTNDSKAVSGDVVKNTKGTFDYSNVITIAKTF